MSEVALFAGDRFYRSQFNTGQASYTIFQKDGVTYADPGYPGGIPYSGIEPASIIRQAAAALSTRGGTIRLTAGTYTISSSQNIGGNLVCIPLYSNVHLVGEGDATILKLDSKANFPDICFLIGNINFTNGLGPDVNIRVANLQLDGNKANRVVTPLNTNGDTLIYFDGSSGVECKNIMIDHVYAHDSNGNCAQYRYTGYSWIRDCLFENNGETGIGTPSGVYFPNTVHDTEVSNVIVKGGAWRAFKLDTWSNLRFVGCEAIGCADDGFSVGAGSDGDWIACRADANTGNGWVMRGSPTSYCRIIGGYYNGNGTIAGDNISLNSITQSTVIGAHAINGVTGNGINIGGASATDILIAGCVCKGNFIDGIFADGTTDSDILISGNRCVGNTGRGIRIGNNPTSGVLILHNDVQGNTVAGISIPASATNIFVRNNIGFNPQGVASITVTASPFTYTNNDSVPEYVSIDGGTITTVAKNAITLYSFGGAAARCGVWLEPGEAVTVTYTVAPTMNKDRK